MNNVEIHIPVNYACEKAIDRLILGLVDCGYSVYHNRDDKVVCFTGDKDELVTELKI